MAGINDWIVGIGAKVTSRQVEIQEQLDKIAKNLTVDTKLAIDYTSSKQEIKEATSQIQNLIKSQYKLETGKDITNKDSWKVANGYIKQYLQSTIKLTNAENNLATASKRNSLANTIQAWNQKNTKAKEAIQLNKEYITTLRNMDVAVSQLDIEKMTNNFKTNINNAREANQLGNGLFDSIKSQAASFFQWTTISGAIMSAVASVRQMKDYVFELDDAITDFSMATDLSKQKTQELVSSYSDLGDELKANVVDVTTSATEWLKQGKSIAETETLITDAMVLSKVGKLSSADATKVLTSAMKGYKIATEDTLSVVDKLSAVDIESATDVGGLAEGMSEVAASANLAGISIDRLLGYLATVGEVTQEGMSSVGTAFNAIFARMGNIKLSRLVDPESGEDLSNVETVLSGVDIKLRDTNSEFRNFGDVLDETAVNWNNYSSVQQRSIANAFAGTHHVDSFITLMSNYDNALKYTEASLNSTGTAMDKFSDYQNSLAGYTEEFKNAYIGLSDTLINTDFLKGAISSGTEFINVLDFIIDKLGILGTLSTVGGGILGSKGLGLTNYHSITCPST